VVLLLPKGFAGAAEAFGERLTRRRAAADTAVAGLATLRRTEHLR
jgi:hypothetical protein